MLLNLCALGYIILKPTLCKYFKTGFGIPAQSCEIMFQTMNQNSTIKMWGASGKNIYMDGGRANCQTMAPQHDRPAMQSPLPLASPSHSLCD